MKHRSIGAVALSLVLAFMLVLSSCGSETDANESSESGSSSTSESSNEKSENKNEESDGGFKDLPAGTYTYVSHSPEADSEGGQVQFDFPTSTLYWAYGEESGDMVLTGDEYLFFESLYVSDCPLYDWLASEPREVEGYDGNLSDYFLITFTDDGKISEIRANDATTNAVAVVSSSILDNTLTVSGETRGQPNLLQSSVTLIGSTNGLYLTDRGNVVLYELSIGHDENGVGLKSDKIGGDTFLVNTVVVDGTVEWFSRYANIQPIQDGTTATLLTNGQTIEMQGANIGRMRDMNISTGDGEGDIIIGETVSVDYGRRDPLEDPTTGTLTLSTTGNITAGTGNVIIGTNSERIVEIDQIGDIQGANVTIHPTDNGTTNDVGKTIGNITATENIDIEIGNANADYGAQGVIGDLTSEKGNITVKSGNIHGSVGDVTAEDGDVTLNIESAVSVGTVSGKEVENNVGEAPPETGVDATPIDVTVMIDDTETEFDAYKINDGYYFQIFDLACAFADTNMEFDVNWIGTQDGEVTLTSGRAYTPTGNEMAPKGTENETAILVALSIYLDSKPISVQTYKIGDLYYFSLDDLASAMGFGVSLDEATNTLTISTT